MLNSVLFGGANKSTNIWNLEQRQKYFFIVYIIFRPTHLAGLAPILTHSNSDAKNHIQFAHCKPSFYNQNHFYFDSLPLQFKGWETIPWFCEVHFCFKHRLVSLLDQMTRKTLQKITNIFGTNKRQAQWTMIFQVGFCFVFPKYLWQEKSSQKEYFFWILLQMQPGKKEFAVAPRGFHLMDYKAIRQ